MLKQNTRIGEFEIIRLLGKGGMGEVYEAQQTRPERRVALKVLVPWLAQDPEALKRFWQEAEVPAKLDHPAIVRIFSTGQCDGIAYYVMQLVEGISLARLLTRANEPTPATRSLSDEAGQRLPLATPTSDATVDDPPAPVDVVDPPVVKEYRADRFRTLAKLGIQAARALAWTHKKGFLHRDIKPSNIMVDHHHQLYLVDFGLTKALDSGLTTRSGTLIGTPYFMSPEQAVGHPLDPRSDIFSLGVSLYQLASGGKGPYRASRKDSDAVLTEVRAGELLPLRAVAPNVPAFLEAIIQRAIDPDPARRYQKAEELADDLERFLNKPEQPAPKQPSSLRWLLAAAAAIVIVSGATTAYVYAPWHERPQLDDPLKKLADNKKPDDDKGAPTDKKPEAKEEKPALREFFKRDRPLRTPVPLLRADNQPVKQKQFLAASKYWSMSKEFVVASRENSHRPGLLALDDPGEQNFEFSVEMKAWNGNPIGKDELGIFFGWRDNFNDPLERPRFFAVKLDRKADNNYPHGKATIGTWCFEDAKEGRGGMNEQDIRVLFGSKDGPRFIALPAPKDTRFQFYRIYVRVENARIAVGVEDETPVTFDVPWIMNNDKGLRIYSLSPYGALGIWTRHGQASFKNISITALPKDP